MCRAEFYKQWSAESICDEREEATPVAQEDERTHIQNHSATRNAARVLIDCREANERADRIVMAEQLRQAPEAAKLIVEQTDEEQKQEHRGGDSD